MKDLEELSGIIKSQLEINQAEENDEYQHLLAMIERRVEELLEKDSGLLFSYIYRLDVSEQLVRQVMTDDDSDSVKALSKLIMDRQLQRLHTKKTIVQKPIRGWEW